MTEYHSSVINNFMQYIYTKTEVNTGKSEYFSVVWYKEIYATDLNTKTF